MKTEAFIKILHLDRHIVVIHKPAGIASVRFHDDERDTLVDRLRVIVRKIEKKKAAKHGGRTFDPMLGVVHRLDKETSGVMVFTRTLAAKRHLESQFRSHTIQRHYHAIVHGHTQDAAYESLIIQNRGDGLRGTVRHHGARRFGIQRSQWAKTSVRLLEHLSGASLVECELFTGRQHQIRIHLSEAGHPLVGERVYIRNFDQKPIQAPRVMLHAISLGFSHPARPEGPEMFFTEPYPSDFSEKLEQLRSSAATKA